MPLDVLVRRAERYDVDALAALSRSLALHVEDPDPGLSVEPLLASGFGSDPWFECYVAEFDERIVGFVLFCRRFEAHTRARSLWIGDLISAKDVRGNGVATALLEAVRSRARALKCLNITFEVWDENRSGLAFYERLDAKVLRDRQLLFLEL